MEERGHEVVLREELPLNDIHLGAPGFGDHAGGEIVLDTADHVGVDELGKVVWDKGGGGHGK